MTPLSSRPSSLPAPCEAAGSGVHERITCAPAPPRVELVVLREALEGVVAPGLATQLIFEALELWAANAPETVADVRRFAEGPLDRVIRKRRLDEEATELAGRLGRLFAHASIEPARDDRPTVEIPLPSAAGARTQQMLVVTERVPVVVLANGNELAQRLTSALGRDRIVAFPVTSDATLTRAIEATGALVVVLDASSPARIGPQALRTALGSLRVGASVVIWGADTANGFAIARVLAGGRIRAITLGRGEGTGPLLDLVLARRAA
jgi:hypothetical protein